MAFTSGIVWATMPQFSISDETLFSGLKVLYSNGRITALPGNQGLKNDEIKVGEDIYKISPEDLNTYKANKTGDQVKVFYMQTDTEKIVLLLQTGAEANDAEVFRLLHSLNIIDGYPDGTLKLTNNITRAEFSKIVVTASGYADVAASAGDAKFSDMTGHWGAGYVNVANSLGIINGMGDGKFAPDENVTYEQAITMLVRMLGYESKAKDYGGFPEGYLKVADEIGITKNIERAVGSQATRGSTGRMLFNSLAINIMKQTGYKPVIYLYPTKEQSVSVKLDLKGRFTYTYPQQYDGGWKVIAKPDGTLTNSHDGMEYSYLFWEGTFSNVKFDLSKGFVVKGQDTTKFLQETLSKMGLTPRERNEFVVYWAPKMHNNKYNLITFAGKEYEEAAPLEINPAPDSILRIFMVYKSLDESIKIEPQEIKPFERKGFTVVEWGGTEVN